jgi:hypothetical protein
VFETRAGRTAAPSVRCLDRLLQGRQSGRRLARQLGGVHRPPEAIIAHPLAAAPAADGEGRGLVSRNMAGWATNVALGSCSDWTPVLGALFGLRWTCGTSPRPLAPSRACAGLAKAGSNGWFLGHSGDGDVLLNLGVSFLLSLAPPPAPTCRALHVRFARAVGRRFRVRPGTSCRRRARTPRAQAPRSLNS